MCFVSAEDPCAPSPAQGCLVERQGGCGSARSPAWIIPHLAPRAWTSSTNGNCCSWEIQDIQAFLVHCCFQVLFLTKTHWSYCIISATQNSNNNVFVLFIFNVPLSKRNYFRSLFIYIYVLGQKPMTTLLTVDMHYAKPLYFSAFFFSPSWLFLFDSLHLLVCIQRVIS